MVPLQPCGYGTIKKLAKGHNCLVDTHLMTQNAETSCLMVSSREDVWQVSKYYMMPMTQF